MKCENCKKRNLLPISVIRAVSHREIEAMNQVLKRCEKYINKLSTRMLYDKYGNQYLCVDEDIRNRLQTKLKERTGTIKTRMNKGLSIEGICESPMVPAWKLGAMADIIFQNFWKDRDGVLTIANEMLDKHFIDK